MNVACQRYEYVCCSGNCILVFAKKDVEVSSGGTITGASHILSVSVATSSQKRMLYESTGWMRTERVEYKNYIRYTCVIHKKNYYSNII